jgi:hypothetical protein
MGGQVSEQTGKVPVLEILDQAIYNTPSLGLHAELSAVRHVVAELIAAATQASATLGHAYHTTLTGAFAEYAHTDYQRLDNALKAVQS